MKYGISCGEAGYMHRLTSRHVSQFSGELLVAPAHHDELQLIPRVLQFFYDSQHLCRALSTEQHESGRAVRVEPELCSLGGAIVRELLIKTGPQNHPETRNR